MIERRILEVLSRGGYIAVPQNEMDEVALLIGDVIDEWMEEMGRKISPPSLWPSSQ